ncbi:hypothetical protein BDV40DRAFT_282472 [Aspergillus tamarii]|uniref:Uncharacterized protein n=1 Tax=Aspergillus tamarii TaxID=41984 RepID=A0A5N6UBL4_ASPTM|nr:hypothetical protein BDV40DRAFT_282472 [Aspergillus tamarii]
MENLAYSATAAGQFLSTLICLSVLGLTSVASIMHGDDVRMQCIIVYISCFQPVPLYCMYVRSTVGFEGKRKGKKTERERERKEFKQREKREERFAKGDTSDWSVGVLLLSFTDTQDREKKIISI